MDKIIVLLFLILAGCHQNKPDNDCLTLKNSRGDTVRPSKIIRFYFNPSVPNEHRPIFIKAADNWEKAVGRKLFEFVDTEEDIPAVTEIDGASVVYWENCEDIGPRVQAYARNYWKGSDIVESDLCFTLKNFRQTNKKLDLESLIVHELGHVIGLTHNESKNSVMNSILAKGEIKRKPRSEDLKNLQCNGIIN